MTLPRRRPKERRKLDTRVKCPGHLKFVREEFECSIKGRVCKSTGERHECWGPIDAHHVRTRGAGGGDEQVVSLCRGAHSLLDSWGWSAKRFDEEFEINLAETAADLWKVSDARKRYEAKERAR